MSAVPSFRRSFLVAVLITAIFSLGAFALDPRLDADGAVIRQWENDALAAELAGDAAFFADGLHVDWTSGIGTGRFLSRRDWLNDLRRGDPDVVLHATIADLDVRVHGDTAVATYRKDYDARMRDEPVVVNLIVTDTFVRDGGRWQQLASHASLVQPAAE